MKAIEISNLSKTFKGKKGLRVEALKGLSLDIEPGEVFGFLGPNGAGKSTTIKTLMGLLKPASGEARIMGVDIKSPAARKQVGYLPENPAFYEYLTAEEYLYFVGATFDMAASAIGARAERLLKLMDLWDARKRPVRSYSKGMVQRLGLAQVLLHDPDVYILDEPMSGLDPVGRALVKDVIVDLKQKGKCVFFSTHITADVEMVCDRVGIIVQGTLRSVERVQTVLTKGIQGYFIRLAGAGEQSAQREAYVPKEGVTEFLAEAKGRNEEVILIEPKRKDLEEFFLEIVKGAA